jgi:hypothetical protein
MAKLSALGVVLALLAAAQPAAAQSSFRPYAGASFGSFDVSADEVDGKSASPGILAGIAVSRFVDIEVDLQFPTRTFTRSTTGVLTSFAPQGSSREEIERLGIVTRLDRHRDVSTNVSVVAIIHPPYTSRVVPALVAGVFNQRAHNRRVYTPLIVPPGVDPNHPEALPHAERGTRNIGGPTIGGNVAIAINRQLWVVPDVRYDYGSIGDEINNAFRTSVRMVWRF